MPAKARNHDALLLALAVVALVVVAAVVSPRASGRYGPTPDSLQRLTDALVRAKAAGGLRLLALLLGTAVVALGHARLAPGPGRSLFTIGGAGALSLWWLAALGHLAFTEGDFYETDTAALSLMDGLARLGDTAALLPAGLAIAGFGRRPAGTGETEASWSPGYAVVGALVGACGLTLGVAVSSEVENSIFRPGGGPAVAGSLLVLGVLLVIGGQLGEMAHGSATGPSAGHDTTTYDLGHWSADQRRSIELLLRVSDVAYGWEGDELIVPQTAEATVDAMVEQVEATEPDGGPG
jgi:hypothetical protein